jgi:hypothetical protein
MDKATAQRIVRETFKAPFDRKRYRNFINELCNGFDESKAIKSMSVPDAFASHVKSCQRLGTFASPEGELADVLIVHLTESYKLERTRTALRDFVAHKLKRDESYKEAGLVAFVAPDSQSWRFSYVRMEYETKRDQKTGKIKAEERLTPARRFSYLVGADEECHTAQTRFLALLQETSEKPTLGNIEEAFSVEAVTKEFFAEYARLFRATDEALAAVVKRDKTVREDFRTKGVITVDFAKKLLGQIVFLYFIQKKGWLGVDAGRKWGDGPLNFMRLLADRAIGSKQDLFSNVLEPLFYDTLATDRGHDAWCETFKCRIPFLNGGLFEPLAGYDWEKTEIDLPNSLFTNKQFSQAGDVGTGILDVFDRYNFTVNEAEPLETDVAIDPEMLGKVFENLIEENRRKGLGAYYTPREIVHYMCQESLVNYLDNGLNHPEIPISARTPDTENNPLLFVDSDEKPKPKPGQLDMTDAGSRSLVLREELAGWIHQSDQFAHYAAAIATGTKGDHYPKPPDSIRKYAPEIDILLRDITVCDPAIGSGAFPVGMMTEIVRARTALTPYFTDLAERTPYHFKRHAIQSSLYGVDIDAGAVEIAKLRLWLSLVVDEEDVQQIKPLPNLDYKVVAGNSLLGVPRNLFNAEQFKSLEILKPKFFDESERSKKAEYKRQIEALIHEITNGREEFDFEVYFSEIFHAKGGFDIVIANPPYVDSETMVREAPEFRIMVGQKFSTTKGNWDLYIPFLELSLLKLSRLGTSCLITPNKWLAISYGQALRDFAKNQIYALADYSHFRAFENVGVFPVVEFASPRIRPRIDISRFSDGHQQVFSTSLPRTTFIQMSTWGAILSEHLPLLTKLIATHAPLSTICSLEEAFTVGEAYRLPELIEDSRNSRGAFKFINTGTIEPFYSLWGYSPTTYLKTKYLCPIIANKAFKEMFPRRYAQMSSSKIIISGIRHFEAMLDLKGEVVAGKSTVVLRGISEEIQWYCLLGILNSRVAKFFLRGCYSALAMDGGINFSPTNVGEIPIPKHFTSDRLLGVTKEVVLLRQKHGPELDRETGDILSNLLAALNDEVLSLYGLSVSEKQMIEDSTSDVGPRHRRSRIM